METSDRKRRAVVQKTGQKAPMSFQMTHFLTARPRGPFLVSWSEQDLGLLCSFGKFTRETTTERGGTVTILIEVPTM